MQLDKDGNIPGVIVQNGESPAAIAKNFGCNVDELMQLNADQLKGKGKNQYFEVGSEIKLPGSVSVEKFNKASEGRKPAEIAKQEYARDAEIRRQKAEAAKQEREYYQKLGVKNFNNKGQKVKADGWGNAHQEQVRSDYSDAHRIENNAKITEQKTSATLLSADETAIKTLENEVGALDGQIKQLNKQLAGAKRANQMGRKNGDTIKKIESQIESLQQKRTAKAAELETARKPVEIKADEVKPEVKQNEAPVAGRAADETPKVEVKSETIINDVNSINTSEIPSQHQKLWQNCKERIEKLTQELSMPNISSKELITRGKELLTSLKTIANSATGAIKAKIEGLYNDIRVMLNNAKKQIQNTHVNDLSAKQKEAVYTLREIYHSDLDDVATLRMDYPQYSYMSDKELLDFFKLDEKHAAFVKNRKDLFANGDAKYMERAYWNDSPYELTNNHSAWKMHLYSVDELDYQQMAEVVLPYLNKHKIAHKTLSSTMSPELLAKTAPEQTGKAFTIYPQSQEEMAQIAKDLDKLIREHNLTTNTSHITGDNQLGDSGRLFYRYEYKTGKLKDRIYTPEENRLMHAAYDSNRGEGQYLAHDMTPADDPWLNFDPSNPQSIPGQKFSQAKEVPINEMRQPTSQERMEMGQISNNINRAKTPQDIAKVQKWLDKMPECSQKTRLQAQLEQKANNIRPQQNNVYIMDLETNEVQLVETDVKLQRGTKQKVSSMESVRLGDQVNINFADFETKFNAMRDGDSFIIGREVNGVNDVRINNEFVSGQHLKVEKINGEIYITDMSRNGTTLNSTKPDYAAQYSPQLQQKFANANYGDFRNMIDDNYRNLRRANYSLEESVSGNITNADLANNTNVNIYESGGWFFRYQKGHRPVDASRVADRISLNVVADKNLLAELDRLCATGTYVNANGQTVKINMPDCTYKTPQSLQGYTTRHDPITMYFEREVSEDVQNAIADIAGKYARQSSNGKSLMNALEGKPYIAHEAYTSPQEAQALWHEAEQLNPSLADAIHQELNDDGTWNCSTGQFAACKKLVDEYKLAYPQYKMAG